MGIAADVGVGLEVGEGREVDEGRAREGPRARAQRTRTMMPTESRGAAEAISFHSGGGFLDLGRGFLNLVLRTRILMPIPSIADADFSIWRSEGDLLPCRVGADSKEESGGERDGAGACGERDGAGARESREQRHGEAGGRLLCSLIE